MELRRVIAAANIDFFHPKTTAPLKYFFSFSVALMYHNAYMIDFLGKIKIQTVSCFFIFYFLTCWSNGDEIQIAAKR